MTSDRFPKAYDVVPPAFIKLCTTLEIDLGDKPEPAVNFFVKMLTNGFRARREFYRQMVVDKEGLETQLRYIRNATRNLIKRIDDLPSPAKSAMQWGDWEYEENYQPQSSRVHKQQQLKSQLTEISRTLNGALNPVYGLIDLCDSKRWTDVPLINLIWSLKSTCKYIAHFEEHPIRLPFPRTIQTRHHPWQTFISEIAFVYGAGDSNLRRNWEYMWVLNDLHARINEKVNEAKQGRPYYD